MKKSIIAASAASLALAAMPVVSTFAVNPTVQDTLNITIDNTCSLTRTAVANTTGTGLTSSVWSDQDVNHGTYTVHMDAGSAVTVGTSTFTVTCNDVKNGHSVTVATTSLSDQATSGTTGAAIAYSDSEVTAAASGWNITIANGTTTPIPAASINTGILQAASGTGIVYDKTAPNRLTQALSGATFDATYKVSAAITQDAGTYQGSATYTLVNGPAS